MGKFRDNTYGVDFGGDIRLGTSPDSAFYLGTFFGYANSDRSFKKAGNADGDSDSLYGGLYGTFVQKDGWYMDAVMKAQYFDNSFKAKSDKKDGFNSYAFGMSLEGGKTIQINEFFLEPSLMIAWAHTANSNYTTKQGLRVTPDDADVLQARAVVRAGGDFKLDNGSVVQPYVKFGVEAQTSSGGDVRFAGERFRTDLDGVRGLVGVGLVWQLEDNVQLHFDYEGAFGSKYNRLFGISAGLRVTF